MAFEPGVYRHFKGGVYEALHLARDSEDHDKQMVVYKNEKGEVWVRPLEMWEEHVERDGYSGLRFTRVK
jgi:hypothetical protein